MKVLVRIFVLSVCLSACTANDSKPETDSDASGQFPVIWDIQIFDKEQQPLGNLKIRLTEEPVDDDYCGYDYFRKAIVLEDNLKADLQGIEKQPAYHIGALWLTIDLTASVCWADYILMGDINKEEAKGFFNYSHPFGGYNIGSFTASPVVE